MPQERYLSFDSQYDGSDIRYKVITRYPKPPITAMKEMIPNTPNTGPTTDKIASNIAAPINSIQSCFSDFAIDTHIITRTPQDRAISQNESSLLNFVPMALSLVITTFDYYKQ